MKRATMAYAPPAIVVRPVRADDAAVVARLVGQRWGGNVVVHGVEYHPVKLPGFLAVQGRKVVGLVTYKLGKKAWEIVTIDSWKPGEGVGTALLDAVREAAKDAGVTRLWLVTTNDNLDALRFYQRREFRLVAVRPGAVDAARAIKPSIPAEGAFDIPIRDELELELILTPPAAEPLRRRKAAPAPG
jgi:GNAT superfamily N-acetyltransferase